MAYLDRDAAREVLRKRSESAAQWITMEQALDALESCVRDSSGVPEKTYRDMTWKGRQYREVTIGGQVKTLYVWLNDQWVNVIGFLPEEDEGIWQTQDTITRS